MWRFIRNLSGHLVAQATMFPLLTIDVVLLWRFGFSWRWLVFSILTIPLTLFLQMFSAAGDRKRIVNEVAQFRADFARLGLQPVSLEECVAAIQRRYSTRKPPSVEELVPLSGRMSKGHIRILAAAPADPEPEVLPAQITTWAGGSGAWIVVLDGPEGLTNVQQFVLLHEIGHCAISSYAPRLGGNAAVRYMAWTAVPLLFMLHPTQLQGLLIGLGAVAVWISQIAAARSLSSSARAWDEISADIFALKRCDPAWFGKHAATDLAAILCQGERDCPDREVRLRTRALAQNIERLRQGVEPIRQADLITMPRLVPFLQDLLIVAVLILCGMAFAPLSNGRLLAFAGLLLAGILAAMVYSLVQNMELSVIDDVLGVRAADPKVWEMSNRSMQIRKRFLSRK